MPKMRPARRSGWNRSKSASFSPVDGESDRSPDHFLHRQRGAAAGVTVELGEDDPVERERLVERLRRGDGVLARHGVDDEERVVGRHRLGDLADLIHQFGVDGQATGGIDENDVAPVLARVADRLPGHFHRIGGLAEDRYADLVAERLQLLHRGGPLKVGRHQERVTTLALEPSGQLGRVGRLTRALQTSHQHDGRWLRRVGDADRLAAERRGQLVVDDLDDLLRGVERPAQLLADAALAHLRHEAFDDLEVDVGLEQRETDLAQDLVDVGFAELSVPTKPLEDPIETIGERLEHEGRRLPVQEEAASTSSRSSTAPTPGMAVATRTSSSRAVSWGTRPRSCTRPSTTATSGWGRCHVRGA